MILRPGDLAVLTFDWTINKKRWPTGTCCLVIDRVDEIMKLSGMQYEEQYTILLPDGTVRKVSVEDIAPNEV